jgi:N-acetylmuramoyl-L-alanine amidase
MLQKSLPFLFFLAASLLLSSYTVSRKQKALRTVIIDAGHGIMSNGGYNGAHGTYSYEDEICLAVSQKLVALLAKELPEVRIVQTRPGKNIVDLHDRAQIANQNKGDLFVSIHVNAAPPISHREFIGNKTVVSYTGKGKKRKKVTKQVPQYRFYTTPNPAKGTETYIWGSHKTEDKILAVRENAPMLAEENYSQKYGDVDPNSPEFIALSLLKTKQFFRRSATLAGMVEEQFTKVGRTSRGQQQRTVGIWVLQATAMPSVLVETGYITNKAEEDYLNSDSGQQEIAVCVTEAVKNYSAWLDKAQTPASTRASIKVVDTTGTYGFLKNLDAHEAAHTAR